MDQYNGVRTIHGLYKYCLYRPCKANIYIGSSHNPITLKCLIFFQCSNVIQKKENYFERQAEAR